MRARHPIPSSLDQTPERQFVGGNIVNDWSDVPPLQMTYLEVMLAQALHRCGGEEERKTYQAFTNDSRAIFRNTAKARLKNQPRNPLNKNSRLSRFFATSQRRAPLLLLCEA